MEYIKFTHLWKTSNVYFYHYDSLPHSNKLSNRITQFLCGRNSTNFYQWISNFKAAAYLLTIRMVRKLSGYDLLPFLLQKLHECVLRNHVVAIRTDVLVMT